MLTAKGPAAIERRPKRMRGTKKICVAGKSDRLANDVVEILGWPKKPACVRKSPAMFFGRSQAKCGCECFAKKTNVWQML